METSSTYYNDLIVRYFSGETSEMEQAEILRWIQDSEENQKVFEEYRKSWLLVEAQAIEESIDLDDEWVAFSEKCFPENQNQTEEAKTIEYDFNTRKRKRMRTFVSIAAILLVTLVSSLLIWKFQGQHQNEEVHLLAKTNKLEQKLPDGSQVCLSPGSSLSFPEKFTGTTREVKLEGDAFFDVAHDPDQAFIIHLADQVSVKVLGTSFYINSCNDSGNIEVVLIRGKVSVYYKDHEKEALILNPGEKTEFKSGQDPKVKNINRDQNFLAWKTGRLVFDNTPLSEVVLLLNKHYHTDIRFTEPALGNCTITTTFENQTLDAVLNVIRETLSLEVNKKGNTIFLSGSVCNP